MKLPRRVPWASLAELEQVCNWIYADEHDLDSKIIAINRLSAWRAITALPHALDATLGLLTVVVEDRKNSIALQDHSQPTSSALQPTAASLSSLALRQSYATALVRLVNGLVDPLQQGAYARSISSIAAQIGLPHWLVELRHAVTHEELPSLELLRSGSGESLAWLFHNYFIPTLTSPDTDQSASASSAKLTPLAPLLKQYKSLLKTITRDASLAARNRRELATLLRAVERWISEARVAASTSASVAAAWGMVAGRGVRGDEGEDWRERWALDRLCEALLGRGGLVPVSPKKRVTSAKHSLTLPNEVLEIWNGLLSSIRSNHPSFPAALVGHIVEALIGRSGQEQGAGDAPTGGGTRDLSYERCLAAWALWLVDEWGTDGSEAEDDNVRSGADSEAEQIGATVLSREDVVAALATAFVCDDTVGGQDRQSARSLLEHLCRGRPHLEALDQYMQPLVQVQRGQTSQRWDDADAEVMQERLDAFLLASRDVEKDQASPSDAPQQVTIDMTDEPVSDGLPPGWSLMPAASWRPCPIGVCLST